MEMRKLTIFKIGSKDSDYYPSSQELQEMQKVITEAMKNPSMAIIVPAPMTLEVETVEVPYDESSEFKFSRK